MGYNVSGNRAKQKRKAPVARAFSPSVKRKNKKKDEKVSAIEISHSEAASSAVDCSDCNNYKEEIEQLQKQVKYWKGLYLKKQHKTLNLRTLDNDSKVKMYTGLPSKNVFDGLFSSFGDKVKKI